MKKLLLILVLANCTLATNWYVDNVATGSNNGTSWANAWHAFEHIVWGGAGVVGGDSLLISGGATSKTYTTVLNTTDTLVCTPNTKFYVPAKR